MQEAELPILLCCLSELYPIDITMGYTLNPEYVSEAVVIVVVSDDVVGWFGCEGGRRRDAQPKYTPDVIPAIYGVRLLSTGRLALGMPSSLEPRRKPWVTLPSICRG